MQVLLSMNLRLTCAGLIYYIYTFLTLVSADYLKAFFVYVLYTHS